jgi:hypothetical protein
MRKLSLTAALLAACAVCLVAQEGAGASASTLLNVGNYSSFFRNGNGRVAPKYTRAASDEDKTRLRGLGGDVEVIDTPLEIALLSTCTGVVDVRPIAAQNMLPANPRIAGLKLGSAVLKEMAELQFLDPSNTAATGRYEGMIKFISDKNGVSRAEIDAYYRQGIRPLITEVVIEKLNEKRNGYVPAEVYAQWKRVGAGDAQALLIDAITSFYLEPSQTTFRKLVEISARQYELSLNGDLFAETGRDAFDAILLALNSSLREKVGYAGLGLNVEVARLDPRYKVFSTPYAE